MRIYLGITGTGGKVLGSFEVGDIFKLKLPDERYFDITGKEVPWSQNETFKVWNECSWENLKEEHGWDMQNYAIEIKDFREEDVSVSDLVKYLPDEKIEEVYKDFDRYGCKHLRRHHRGYESACCINIVNPKCCFNEDINFYWECPLNRLKKLPQSFQYIRDGNDQAILMSIDRKWFDMIASGEKKYEFRNVLPNALKGGK